MASVAAGSSGALEPDADGLVDAIRAARSAARRRKKLRRRDRKRASVVAPPTVLPRSRDHQEDSSSDIEAEHALLRLQLAATKEELHLKEAFVFGADPSGQGDRLAASSSVSISLPSPSMAAPTTEELARIAAMISSLQEEMKLPEPRT
jgi:hypothetical protein